MPVNIPPDENPVVTAYGRSGVGGIIFKAIGYKQAPIMNIVTTDTNNATPPTNPFVIIFANTYFSLVVLNNIFFKNPLLLSLL